MNAADSQTLSSPGLSTLFSKRWVLWVGRVLTALPVLMMVASATMKLMHSPQLIEQFVGKYGFPESSLASLAVIELLCVILYTIPRTTVLGAVLLTGYLGGACATHVRVGDSFLAPVLVGVVVWAGLFLRDGRIRALLPLRAPAAIDA
jgi:hypothetical protein